MVGQEELKLYTLSIDLQTIPDFASRCTALKLVSDRSQFVMAEVANPQSPFHFIKLVTRSGTKRMVVIKGRSGCPIADLSLSGRIYVTRCLLSGDHAIIEVICSPKEMESVLERGRKLGYGITILKGEGIERDTPLTPKQEAVLKAAWILGYFDVPSKSRVRDVADLLGNSPSAVSESLKRAIRKLVASWMS
jgi:predicted DNA binding protein